LLFNKFYASFITLYAVVLVSQDGISNKMHPIFSKAFFADLMAYLHNSLPFNVKLKDNFWGLFQGGKSVFYEAGNKICAFAK
jgi:hypothetical protein